MSEKKEKTVNSNVVSLKTLLEEKFQVKYYQRDYVWQTPQISDLISDLATEFLKNWKPGDKLDDARSYAPYFMGEIVLSTIPGERSPIIDGQQRITTITLLLIYLLQTYKNVPSFPASTLESLVCSDDYGTLRFNLEVEERKECMNSLFKTGEYQLKPDDNISVQNIVARYNDIGSCWDSRINESNVSSFAYWLINKVVFSKVWTDNEDFAYVIFETMNDRGLSLTQEEMLRSYVLANIEPSKRTLATQTFDEIMSRLVKIKLSTKSKAAPEFFRIYFRSHLAESFSQSPTQDSDFTKIGKYFHRWIRDNEVRLGLVNSDAFVEFLDHIDYFSKVYERINSLIAGRDAEKYLYLIVNSDYKFTLQTPAIMAAIRYGDSEAVIDEKLKIVSKYITKVLTYRTWNQWWIAQSAMEAPVYQFAKDIRDRDIDELKAIVSSGPLNPPSIDNSSPTLNSQIKNRLRVMISLITAIVGRESNEFVYMLNKDDIEVEHIWSDHFDQHQDEFQNENDFANARNNIGDLLVLPKSFNASYGDDPYEVKVQQYFSQNILVQTLCTQKYSNAPGFLAFKTSSNLPFTPYAHFKKDNIDQRANLYREILKWDFSR